MYSAAIVLLLICGYPLWFMLRGPQSVSAGALRAPGAISSNLANFIIPGPTQLFAPNHIFAYPSFPIIDGNPLEWNCYLGIPLIVLLVLCSLLFWKRNRQVQNLSACLLIFINSFFGTVSLGRQWAPNLNSISSSVF